MSAGYKIAEKNGLYYSNLFVQAPTNAQPACRSVSGGWNYNRYSYCLNNPLMYTDPTGYNQMKWAQECFNEHGGGGLDWSWGDNLFPKIAWFGTDYHYDWKTGKYRDINGNTVPYSEVYYNYVIPNSSVYQIGDPISPSGDATSNPNGSISFTVFVGRGSKNGYGNVVENILGDINVYCQFAFGLYETTINTFGIEIPQGQGDKDKSVVGAIIDCTVMLPIDFIRGVIDFQRNYQDMRTANWKNSDKYFHAKANFQAAQHGLGGIIFAIHFSNLREIWDQNVKGYPRSDSELDQAANLFGREKARFYEPNEFREALWIYRPNSLPSKY